MSAAPHRPTNLFKSIYISSKSYPSIPRVNAVHRRAESSGSRPDAPSAGHEDIARYRNVGFFKSAPQIENSGPQQGYDQNQHGTDGRSNPVAHDENSCPFRRVLQSSCRQCWPLNFISLTYLQQTLFRG